jgi:hypothetical protein
MTIAPDTALNTARLALRRVNFCDIDLVWQANRKIDEGNHRAMESILYKT